MTLENFSLFSDDFFFPQYGNSLSPIPKALMTVDGIQSGVPTITTPTLTPTTLRSIDESISLFESDPTSIPFQAGFKPPPLNQNCNYIYNNLNEDVSEDDSQCSWNMQNNNDESSQATTDNSSAATDTTSFQNGPNGIGNNSLTTSSSTTNDFTNITFGISPAAVSSFGIEASNRVSTSSNRRSGGRRPAQQANLSPEEELKRTLRRERNKLAAARCRKRRVDQTNELQTEVEHWEKKRDQLKEEYEFLSAQKTKLEYELERHRPTCQKIQKDLLTVNTINGYIISPTTNGNAGLETNLASIANRSNSPLDIKSGILLQQIKNEPEELNLDNSSLDGIEGPPTPKRPLPNVATLQASLNTTLNTPVMQTAPLTFGSIPHTSTLNALNKPLIGGKQRPDSLIFMPRNAPLTVSSKQPTEIHGVPIQTPSTGTFNFDSLMDGGTGLTPVAGPLIPTCSSQNKLPIELTTPTSEPSKLVSL